MANKATKATSTPLFGSPTPAEVVAIQNRMQKFTDNVVRNSGKARKLLENIGAVSAAASAKKPR